MPRIDSNDDRRCDFCALPKAEDRRLVAGPGVAICEACVAAAANILDHDSRRVDHSRLKPRWETMTDSQVLDHLPEIAAVESQVEKRLHEWVGIARERGISWARIGDSLSMTRQSAWERFTAPRVADSKSNPKPTTD